MRVEEMYEFFEDLNSEDARLALEIGRIHLAEQEKLEAEETDNDD